MYGRHARVVFPPLCYLCYMPDDDVNSEIERLRAENAQPKRTANRAVSLKVSKKGGVSVYGLGHFPVTLYKEQWTKLLEGRLPAGLPQAVDHCQDVGPADNRALQPALAGKSRSMMPIKTVRMP